MQGIEPSENDKNLRRDEEGKERLASQPELRKLGIRACDIDGYWGCPNYVRVFCHDGRVAEIWA